MEEGPELRSARLLLNDTSAPRYCRGPLSNVIALVRRDLIRSRTALATLIEDEAAGVPLVQNMSSGLGSFGADAAGSGHAALAAQLEENMKCLIRASAESRHQDEIVAGAARGRTHKAVTVALPGAPDPAHSDIHEVLQRVRGRLGSCCSKVNEFLCHRELATLSSFPRMSSPYRALRHLLVAEYEFGECLQHTKDPWSSVVPEMVPKLENECASVEASLEKWEWTEGARVDLVLVQLAAVLEECERARRVLETGQQSVDNAATAKRKLRLLLREMDRFYEFWNETALPVRSVPDAVAPLQRLLTPVQMSSNASPKAECSAGDGTFSAHVASSIIGGWEEPPWDGRVVSGD